MQVRRGPATVTGVRTPGARDCPVVRSTRGVDTPREAGPRAVVPVHRRRRPRRPPAGAAAQRRLAGRRRRPGARREGHRQVDHRARAGRAAAAGRRRRRLPVLLRPGLPDPECPDGPHEPHVGVARYAPARLVELPVGASEDRVVGSLDLERALTEGVKAFEPGLLAAAHRGVLYVDEVNLLHDHLVDLLLDAAALGTAYVEREGVSVRHASRFLLVGTMNPEEGELRPQLLDRFGLTVEVRATREPSERAEVVRRRLAYEADPAAFAAALAGEEARARRAHRARARTRLPRWSSATTRCARSPRSAPPSTSTGCAPTWSPPAPPSRSRRGPGATRSPTEDVRQAALLALPHRRRRNPFDAPGLDESRLDEALDAGPRTGRPEPPDPEPDRRGRRRRPGGRRRATASRRPRAPTTAPAARPQAAGARPASRPAAVGATFRPAPCGCPAVTRRRRRRSAAAAPRAARPAHRRAHARRAGLTRST